MEEGERKGWLWLVSSWLPCQLQEAEEQSFVESTSDCNLTEAGGSNAYNKWMRSADCGVLCCLLRRSIALGQVPPGQCSPGEGEDQDDISSSLEAALALGSKQKF